MDRFLLVPPQALIEERGYIKYYNLLKHFNDNYIGYVDSFLFEQIAHQYDFLILENDPFYMIQYEGVGDGFDPTC